MHWVSHSQLRSSCKCMRAQDKHEQKTNLPLHLNAHRILNLPFVKIEPTIFRVCSQLYKYLKLSSPTSCHESEFVVPDILSAKILDCPLRCTCTSSNFSLSLKKRKKRKTCDTAAQGNNDDKRNPKNLQSGGTHSPNIFTETQELQCYNHNRTAQEQIRRNRWKHISQVTARIVQQNSLSTKFS